MRRIKIFDTTLRDGEQSPGIALRPDAKVEIAVARGKDLHDKRDSIRDRDMARDVQRELRDAQR